MPKTVTYVGQAVAPQQGENLGIIDGSTDYRWTCNVPTGTATGDLLVLSAAENASVAITLDQAGWTRTADNVKMYNGTNFGHAMLAYRFVKDGDPTSYSITMTSGSNTSARLWLTTYRNVASVPAARNRSSPSGSSAVSSWPSDATTRPAGGLVICYTFISGWQADSFAWNIGSIRNFDTLEGSKQQALGETTSSNAGTWTVASVSNQADLYFTGTLALQPSNSTSVPTNLLPSGATGANTVTLSATYSDPESDSGRVEFQTATDSAFTANVVNHTGSTVASGSTSSVSVTLAANTTYYLRARAIDSAGAVSAYTAAQTFITNRPPSAPGAFTTPTSGEVVNTTDLVEVGAASDPDGQALTYDFDLTLDNGATWTAKRTKAAGVSFTYDYTNEAATTTAKWRTRAWDGLVYGLYTESPLFTVQHNQAPTAPTGLAPDGGVTIDRDAVQRFSWQFNDPDAGDSQSAFDVQYRQGANAWTVVSVTSTNRFHDFAAGTFAAGDWEWQVRTYDSQGVASPFSASAFFTAATAPAAPSITEPLNGATVGTQDSQVKWSAPSQGSFQVRTVADNAGAADPATVYSDTGEVVSATARNAALSFPVNNRHEHVQVRIKVNGLWSTWASVRVLVSYTPPAVSVLTPTGDAAVAAIRVGIAPGPWPVTVGPVTYTGTGTGTMTGPTATAGTTDSHSWTVTLVTAAVDGGTFDVAKGGTVVGQAVVGTAFTHEGLTFTINDGATDFAVGDRFAFTTTAVKTSGHDVWRRVAGAEAGIRLAKGLAAMTTFTDYTPGSGVDYEYQAVAYGTNGTTATSAWTP